VRPDEFTELIARDYPRLVRALALSCGNRQVAEDAVQEALVRAWERVDRGEEIRSMVGWVAVVAMNETRTLFRRSATERRALLRLEAQLSTRTDAACTTCSTSALTIPRLFSMSPLVR
jgi:DNA-directed RNA polymerase specialized sigma24 family protein